MKIILEIRDQLMDEWANNKDFAGANIALHPDTLREVIAGLPRASEGATLTEFSTSFGEIKLLPDDTVPQGEWRRVA